MYWDISSLAQQVNMKNTEFRGEKEKDNEMPQNWNLLKIWVIQDPKPWP